METRRMKMCRECDNSSLEWTERDEREVEIARGEAVQGIDKSIKILEENLDIIDGLKSIVSNLEDEVKKI
jgi:hypothetical protein